MSGRTASNLVAPGGVVAGIAVGVVAVVAVVAVVVGLLPVGSSSGVGSSAAAGPPAGDSPAAGAPAASRAPAGPGSPSTRPLRGLRVAIDPGHNGGNAAHPAQINRLVPDGRGGRKPCNTVGTATVGGYPEHALVWNLAIRMRNLLRERGARVTFTRRTDRGVGPCVNRRGHWPRRHRADVMMSIHANGSTDRTIRGFHVIRSWPPLSRSQRTPSRRLAHAVRNAMRAHHFTVNPRYGEHGIDKRPDLATVNFARRPTVMVEVGEMRNRHDAAVMTSKHGRSRYAHALVGGLRRWARHR